MTCRFGSGRRRQVLVRTRVEGPASAELPDLKADVVEPGSLGEVLPVEALGVTGSGPGEHGHLRSGDSTGGHLGVAVGVVSADCLEFKVRRAQAHPFLRQSTLARWASSWTTVPGDTIPPWSSPGSSRTSVPAQSNGTPASTLAAGLTG